MNGRGGSGSPAEGLVLPPPVGAPLRGSRYNVVVALTERRAILFNGFTFSMDGVPARLAAALSGGQIPRGVSEDVRSYLRRRGYLTELSPEQETAFLVEHVRGLDEQGEAARAAPTFVFVLTYDCNLRCPYCFQAPGGRRPARGVMSLDLARRAMDAVRAAPRHPSKTGMEIFGGEPLLPGLEPVLRYLVREGTELGFQFTATTNGTFLHRYEDLLGPHGIGQLIVTLDGPPEIHDRRRVGPERAPTFDLIVRNIHLALQRGVEVGIRVNLDRSNLGGLPELARRLDAEGLLRHERTYVYYGVVKGPPGEPLPPEVLGFEDVLDFLDAQEPAFPELAHIHDQEGGLWKWLSQGPHARKTRFCGAAGGSVFIGPDGELFTCNEAVGRPDSAVGSLGPEGFRFREDRLARWRDRPVFRFPGCAVCPHALLCAGGCGFRAMQINGDDGVDCNAFDRFFARTLQREHRLAFADAER